MYRLSSTPRGKQTRVVVASWASVLLMWQSATLTGCASWSGSHAVTPNPAAVATPAAAPCNLWSFLLPTPAQRQSLCNCICASPMGQMANNMLKPVSLFSGGLVPGICPGPDKANPADLAKPADSAEGAAARIKQSEADAKARRAAIRYLGTVDCRRFPEAEAAIINALLTDTNECVRLEAALALGSGCCCTPATIKALMQVISCGEGTDNDPPERSQRVKCAAAQALERCLARCSDDQCGAVFRPESPLPPEQPAPGTAPSVIPPAEPLPPPQLTPPAGVQTRTDSLREQARRALAEYYNRQTEGVAGLAAESGDRIRVAAAPAVNEQQPAQKPPAETAQPSSATSKSEDLLNDVPWPPLEFLPGSPETWSAARGGTSASPRPPLRAEP